MINLFSIHFYLFPEWDKCSGLVDKIHGSFGMVDNLYMTYGGNRLASVRDNATQLTYEGATDFNGEPNKEYPLTYNDAGSLISDAGRKIAKIDYDDLNNPIRIQFTDGNVTKYIYSATGEKLRVIYQTAVPNIAVAIGDTKELAPSEIQCTDYNDYSLGGNLTLKNGHIDKYQFEEGYCQAEKNSSNASIDDFTFYYYDKDHLGNIRQVTKADGSQTGNVVQTINYYPFGMQFCDGTTYDIDQKHKYNGKEFDNMHGLNTYDYGARQYSPVTARWDRMDPLCEKYYSISPYAYCADNPINSIDPDGIYIYCNNHNAVYYDAKSGTYKCNRFTNADTRTIVSGLQTTEAGTKALTMGVKTPTVITFTISDETIVVNNGYKLGIADTKNVRIGTKGYYRNKKFWATADIKIYTGSIQSVKDEKIEKDKDLNMGETIIAVAGHELVHAADPTEVEADIKNIDPKTHKLIERPDGEVASNKVEKSIYDQTIERLHEEIKRLCNPTIFKIQ